MKETTTEVGTYRPSFDSVIDTLAAILEQRDEAYEAYIEDGRAMIERISDRGAKNMVKNPRLSLWMDLNTQALAYWKELGLTPAGLKRIDDSVMKNGAKTATALEKALERLSV